MATLWSESEPAKSEALVHRWLSLKACGRLGPMNSDDEEASILSRKEVRENVESVLGELGLQETSKGLVVPRVAGPLEGRMRRWSARCRKQHSFIMSRRTGPTSK